MSVDLTKLGVVAAELMESLARDHEGEDAEIGAVAVIVELHGEREDGGEEVWTEIDFRCTDARPWVQIGLFAAAERVAAECE